jgi:hypothetical protein
MSDYKDGDIVEATKDITANDGRVIIPSGAAVKVLGIANMNVDGDDYVAIHIGGDVGTLYTVKSNFTYLYTPEGV